MDKELFENIKKRIENKYNRKFNFTYDNYKDYICNIENKVNYNIDIYNKNEKYFILSEIAIIIWGLIGVTFSDVFKDNERISIIIHSLSTQISNNILGILLLINNSLDFQCGIILRNYIELNLTLMVTIINKEKRIKYFEAIKFDKETKVWHDEFKMEDMLEELKKFEDVIAKDDVWISKTLKKYRKKNYKYFSKYTHNAFFMCFVNSYTYPKHNNQQLKYNLWGEYSTRAKMILSEINEMNFINTLTFLKCMEENADIWTILSDTSKEFWKDAGFLWLFYQELYFYYLS